MAEDKDGNHTLPISDPDLTDCTVHVPDTTVEAETESTLSDTGCDNAGTSSTSGEKKTKKRKHRQHEAGSQRHSKPKLCHVHKASSSESQSSGVDSALSSVDIPGNTSDWDSAVLERLGISSKIVREEQGEEEDENFIQSFVTQHFLDEQDLHDYETYKEKMKTHLDQNISTHPFIRLDFTHLILKLLDSIDVESVPVDDIELNVNIRKAEDCISEVFQQGCISEVCLRSRQCHQLEFWSFINRVLVSCKNFLDTLKEMGDERKTRPLSEKMYELLFTEFLKAFSLNTSQAFAKTANLTLQVSGREHPVTSTTEVLVGFRNRDDLSTRKVVAVCQVKKDYCKSEETRRNSKSHNVQSNSRDIPACIVPVSSQLLGQHGGELLVHLTNSLFKEKGILGMIVQATQVSFTALVPDKDYMTHLRDGLEKGSKKADLFLSTPYNFLTKEGREKLYDPLMELFFVQMFFQEKDRKSNSHV